MRRDLLRATLERFLCLLQQLSLVLAITGRAALYGFPEPFKVAEIAQGPMRHSGSFGERQILLPDSYAQRSQRGQNIAVTLALDPQAMQFFAPQCPEMSPLL
ncbi:hypothetical protein SAMN05443247_09399 [Bradyrhizobium erythrophlei]|jgi:hypothetical protein|nr:hypothetical protein SAMN05443247_09399 [Bradyrhizobium erythrophlei]